MRLFLALATFVLLLSGCASSPEELLPIPASIKGASFVREFQPVAAGIHRDVIGAVHGVVDVQGARVLAQDAGGQQLAPGSHL